jgi:hypothetical protein
VKIPKCEVFVVVVVVVVVVVFVFGVVVVVVEDLTEGGSGGSGLSGGFLPDGDAVCCVENFSLKVVFEDSFLLNKN